MSDPLAQDDSEHVRAANCASCGQSQCKQRLLMQHMTKPASALDTQVAGNHYKDMVIQPVEYVHKNGIGYIEGSIIKYVSRWRKKNGVEDLRKARYFLDLLIEMEATQS